MTIQNIKNRALSPENPEVNSAGHPNTNYYRLTKHANRFYKRNKKKQIKDKYGTEVIGNRPYSAAPERRREEPNGTRVLYDMLQCLGNRPNYGTFVPTYFRYRERKYQGAKVPPMVLSLLGAKVRGNESSSYQQTDRHTTFRRPVE